MKVATVATCGLLWHRQDIAAASQTIVRAYTDDQLLDGLRMDRRERPFFTPGFARSTPLQHATRWTLDASAATPFPPEAAPGPHRLRHRRAGLARSRPESRLRDHQHPAHRSA